MFVRCCLLLTLLFASACGRGGEGPAPQKGPVVGKQYSYALDLAAHSDLPQGAVGAQTKLDYSLKARVVVSPLSETQDEQQFLLRVDSPELSSKVAGSADQFAGLGAELRISPFLFSLRQGRLVEVRMPRSISAFAGAILLTIASQFQLPEQRPATAIEVQEHDGTGDYTARYEPGATNTQLRKSKLRYGTLSAASHETKGFSQQALTPRVEKSSSVLEVEGTLLRSAALEETLASLVFGQGELKGHTSLKLTLAGTTDGPKHDIPALFTETSRYEVGKPFFKQPTRKLFDDVRLQGRSFEDISAALVASTEDPRAAEVQKGDHGKLSPEELKTREGWLKGHADAFGGLVALYREQPDSVAKAAAVIRRGGPKSAALLDGLATAGTPASQSALIQLMQDASLDPTVRSSAAAALFRTKAVTADVVTATEAALDDALLGVQAVYAAGTFARILRESGDSKASMRLAEKLVGRLQASTAPPMTVHLLRGISNSAYSVAIPAIQKRLTDPNEDVRSAAVDAFRLMEDPRVDALIAAQVRRTDTSTDYRLAALRACKGRRGTRVLVDAAIDRALHDESKSMKFNAIALLGEWKNEFADVMATLKKISETDADVETREAARLQL